MHVCDCRGKIREIGENGDHVKQKKKTKDVVVVNKEKKKKISIKKTKKKGKSVEETALTVANLKRFSIEKYRQSREEKRPKTLVGKVEKNELAATEQGKKLLV